MLKYRTRIINGWRIKKMFICPICKVRFETEQEARDCYEIDKVMRRNKNGKEMEHYTNPKNS
jgi:hypothetical protein